MPISNCFQPLTPVFINFHQFSFNCNHFHPFLPVSTRFKNVNICSPGSQYFNSFGPILPTFTCFYAIHILNPFSAKEEGGGGREDQWEAWNWSCDLKANETQLYGCSRQCSRPVLARCSMGFTPNPLINGLILHTFKLNILFLEKCALIHFDWTNFLSFHHKSPWCFRKKDFSKTKKIRVRFSIVDFPAKPAKQKKK